MKLIRKGVFETNSSSTHSITVESNTGFTSISPNNDGEIVIKASGEYGWAQETYKDPVDKLDYITIYARDWCGESSEQFLSQIKNCVEEHTGATVKFEYETERSWNGNDHNSGYIDHQSVEMSDYHHLFLDDGKLLKDFIFGIGSELETDNDNH